MCKPLDTRLGVGAGSLGVIRESQLPSQGPGEAIVLPPSGGKEAREPVGDLARAVPHAGRGEAQRAHCPSKAERSPRAIRAILQLVPGGKGVCKTLEILHFLLFLEACSLCGKESLLSIANTLILLIEQHPLDLTEIK